MGNGNYIYDIFDTFVHFTLCAPQVCLVLGIFYIYFQWSIYSSPAPELYLRFYWYVCESYNSVCIFIFVYVIQYIFWLYFILVFCFYLSPVNVLFHNCIIVTYVFVLIFLWMLYLWLLRYVCVLHTNRSLVVLNLGNRVVHIFYVWFFIPLL